jgi:hypothetical protein
MIRTVNKVERNIVALPARVFTLVAATSTEVLPDVSNSKDEFSGRYIQNVGTVVLYYAFGQPCDDSIGYHGRMAVGEQLDCSNHPQAVNVYGAAGAACATTVLRRDDFVQQTPFQNPV